MNLLSQYNFCVQILGGQEWPPLLLRVFAIRFIIPADVLRGVGTCTAIMHGRSRQADRCIGFATKRNVEWLAGPSWAASRKTETANRMPDNVRWRSTRVLLTAAEAKLLAIDVVSIGVTLCLSPWPLGYPGLGSLGRSRAIGN